MKKIKIVGVSFDYDYSNEETVRQFSEDIPWTEVTDEFYNRLIKAIRYKHYLKADDPWYQKSVILLEDLKAAPIDLEQFLTSVEGHCSKEEAAREKREKAKALAQKDKEAKALERKRKTLEKLQKELGGIDN